MSRIKIDETDRLFSLYIRSRDGWTCQRCETKYTPPTGALHCSHYHGRAKKTVRWSPENCTALCYGCHRYLGGHPEIHREFMMRRLGRRRFDALMVVAGVKSRKPDKKLLRKALRQELKDMGYGYLI